MPSTANAIIDYLGRGPHAVRPAAPNIAGNALALFETTEDRTIWAWDGAAWWPLANTTYTLPIAASDVLGGVMIDGDTTTIGPDGTLKAPQSGVRSFNTRKGDILLLGADVTGALGFTPYDAANPQHYQTDLQVSGYAVPLAQRGAPNGVATLDGTGVIPTLQLPPVATGTLSYQGVWDPVANTNPTLATGGKVNGAQSTLRQYWVVYQSATLSPAIDGITAVTAGDWMVSNGIIWQQQKTSSGFGTMASQFANAVAITGGTATGLTQYGSPFALWTDFSDPSLYGPSAPAASMPLFTFESPGGYWAGQIAIDGTLRFHNAIFDIASIPTLSSATETVTNWLDLGFVRFYTAGPGLGGPSTPTTMLGFDDASGNTTGRIDQDGTLSWGKGYFRTLAVDALSLNQPLTIGGTQLAPQPNDLLPMYPYTEEDTAGNIGRVVSGGGRIIGPPARQAAMVRNRIRPGYMMSTNPPTNGGGASIPAQVGHTYASVWSLAADFDWVRLLFHNDRAEGYTIAACTVAPSASLNDQVHPVDSTGALIPGTQVTWNNGGQDLPHYAQNSGSITSYTIPPGWRPSGYIGNQYQLIPTDWINVRSLPRTDGGKYPLLFVYALLTGARPRLVSMGGGGTGNAATPPGTMVGRFTNVAHQLGDFTQNYAGFTATPPINVENNIAPYGIQFMLRNGRGVTIMGVGDSINHGTGAYLATGWAQHCEMGLSDLAKMPVGLWVAWNGAGSDDFCVNAMQTIPLLKPQVVVITSWSPNLSDSPNFTWDDTNRMWRAAMDTAIVTEQYGGVPILYSPPGFPYITPDTEPMRVSAKERCNAAAATGMLTLNWDDFTALPGTDPVRQDPLLTSGALGVHPNDEGHALFSRTLMDMLRQMLEV